MHIPADPLWCPNSAGNHEVYLTRAEYEEFLARKNHQARGAGPVSGSPPAARSGQDLSTSTLGDIFRMTATEAPRGAKWRRNLALSLDPS